MEILIEVLKYYFITVYLLNVPLLLMCIRTDLSKGFAFKVRDLLGYLTLYIFSFGTIFIALAEITSINKITDFVLIKGKHNVR